jgi:F-type H+-transporting ATPase subunit b
MHKLIALGLLVVGLLLGQSDLVAPAFASDASHASEAAHGDAHAAPGAPLGFKSDLAIWSLVTFVVYIIVLKKAAWGPLIQGLDARENRMKQQLADAEAARVKAEVMLAEHAKKLDKVQDEVKEILAEARRDAEHTKQDIVATANKEAEATRRRAVEDIERARDVAMKELFDFVSTNVIGATEHVLGRALSNDDQQRLVQDALSQMGSKT